MKNKIIYLILIISSLISPLLISADGGVIRPLPNGDWTWVDENSQQAFINYERGSEKLIIAADIKKENADTVWIIPIPSKPDKVETDITSELPIFFGDDVMSKAKLNFSHNLESAYYAGLVGQIWPALPLSFLLVSLGGARSSGVGQAVPGDSVTVESHIEKAGMVAEVITAENGQAIYNYFSQKGFNIKAGSITELNSYIAKNYSFVVSWISGNTTAEESKEQRGIFISFPTPKIFYPLMLTSAYGETKIPITIRVLGHVRPEIFSEIKPYTEVSYFTNRTKGGRSARCQADLSQMRAILEMYADDHNSSYPSSLQELSESEYRNQTETIMKDINQYCQSSLFYSSNQGKDYTIRTMLSSGLFEINSSGFVGAVANTGDLVSPELQKFYGNEKPYIGEAEYTRIIINSPAKLLKNDLWIEKGRSFEASFALWAINNPKIVILISYLLIVGIFSFIAGGIAGFIRFRKFKKYALVGLSNIFTLISLILVSNYVKKKSKEDIEYSKLGFVTLFSIIFTILLLSSPVIWSSNLDMGWLVIFGAIWVAVSWIILLIIKFFLNKIGLKNGLIRTLLTIALFIILWIAIGFLIVLTLL